jgi:hypothetical protein
MPPYPAYLQNAVRAIDLLFGSFAPVDETLLQGRPPATH